MKKIQATCFLYNKKLAEMEIPHDDIPARITFVSDQISSVRERTKDDDENVICDKTCYVYLKSGESFQVNTSYDKFINDME